MTTPSSSGKESVIRVLKANAGKRMTTRNIHDYMLAKDYKMCGMATIGKALETLRDDEFIEIQNEEGTPHVKSTAPKGRRQMYAVWLKPEETPVIPARTQKVPMHKSLAAAQDIDVMALCEEAPDHVTKSMLWLALNEYDILIVKK